MQLWAKQISKVSKLFFIKWLSGSQILVGSNIKVTVLFFTTLWKNFQLELLKLSMLILLFLLLLLDILLLATSSQELIFWPLKLKHSVVIRIQSCSSLQSWTTLMNPNTRRMKWCSHHQTGTQSSLLLQCWQICQCTITCLLLRYILKIRLDLK